MIKKLLSLPPNLVECFHDVTSLSPEEWFCTNDPVGRKLGSGGGTTWLLQQYEQTVTADEEKAREQHIILHAGGQSRRLPAYAPSGKILTPIPVFRWERGQRLGQDLLSLQVPLYERIMAKAPKNLRTMIVSGDVFIRATEPLQQIPDADVVCYGLWLSDEIAKDHGVFVASHDTPSVMKSMLQKPSLAKLQEVRKGHFYLVDIGIWLLSDKAMEVLRKRSTDAEGNVINYDLYSDFGCALGTHPGTVDPEVAELSVAVLPLPGGEFYHYGTTHEILSSTLAVQNIVVDQREIMHRSQKAHPSMFVQNTELRIRLTEQNANLWAENAVLSEHWTISHDNVITGVPENDWTIALHPKQCLDVVPVGEKAYAVRPYGYDDKFRGDITDGITEYLGMPMTLWAEQRGIDLSAIEGKADLQSAKIFPLIEDIDAMGLVARWMLNEPELTEGRDLWLKATRLSADDISAEANLRRLTAQRNALRANNWQAIAKNHEHSVFYQTDLYDAAQEFAAYNIPAPAPIDEGQPLLKRIHDAMFRSELTRLNGGDAAKAAEDEQQAFRLLQQGLTQPMLVERQQPKMSVYGDQIVWGRSPVRIDLAGGWSDTPPYCLMEGGSVVNIAIDLNGQQPIQTYVRPCREHHIILRSIDLGASETITTYEELRDFHHVGSPFSIPKAALVLCGFQPGFSKQTYTSLEQQLDDFGCGFEVTLLSAIPAGSGLGTSSVLAATVLGALNDFCGLAWDKTEIGRRTLILEQLLTTGGGWQDQFGGILEGAKLLTTERGFEQNPQVRWLPSTLYTQPEYKACHLLYYTGITRTAKTLLAEIVRKMFLNHGQEIALLREMKVHANDMYEAIQHGNFRLMGELIGKTWQQNQLIDAGTNPEGVRRITEMIDDLCLGYKLPGAGGGGYLYMVAKDPEAAAIIKQRLQASPQNANARFVDMTLSNTGLQVSRS